MGGEERNRWGLGLRKCVARGGGEWEEEEMGGEAVHGGRGEGEGCGRSGRRRRGEDGDNARIVFLEFSREHGDREVRQRSVFTSIGKALSTTTS